MITLKELSEYSNTMREHGIASLESSDLYLKITLGDKPPIPITDEKTVDPKLDSIKSMLKMDNNTLAEYLFPDPDQEEHA